MSAGGMDWAYRMIQAHRLDALGALIVMHLGWRDNPSQRTDRAIARELARSRAAVQAATAKLVQMGILQRCPKGLIWLSSENVAIVRGDAWALEPDAASRDDAPKQGVALSRVRPSVGAGGGPLSGPQVALSRGHKRKENIEKRACAKNAAQAGRSASPRDAALRPASTLEQKAQAVAAAGSDAGRIAQGPEKRRALAASLGLPYLDTASGQWVRPSASLAIAGEKGVRLCRG